jgi:hypothetical protein
MAKKCSEKTIFAKKSEEILAAMSLNSGNPGLQPVGLSAAAGYARQTGSQVDVKLSKPFRATGLYVLYVSQRQCCGSGFFESRSGYGSGSSISSESGSGSNPDLGF